MKYFIGITFVLLNFLVVQGQVTVTSDLPSEIVKNKEIVVTVKFNKGLIKNYSKYEMTLPDGISVKEVDCRYGAFSTEGNKIRVIWAITPADPVYVIKLNFIVGSSTGAKQISQTYAYAEKGQKLELEMAKINFVVVDSLKNESISKADTLKPVLSSEENKESEQKTAALTNTSNSENNTVASESSTNAAANPETDMGEVRIESGSESTETLKETKEAEAIGNAEKANAELKIAAAKTEMMKADSITDAEKKKEAIEAANASKRKAEEQLSEAERILTLSKSINEGINKTESNNKQIDSLAKVSVTVENTASKEEVKIDSELSNKPAVKIESAKENAMNKGEKDAQDLYKSIKLEDHHDDPQIQMQVSQLRLDSRDAKEVGTREKLKAEQSLHDAYEALKKTKYIPDAEEKKLAIEKANADIEQAKADLEIASKILALSKSLEENAKEIERLHLSDEANAKTTGTVASNGTEKPAKEVISLNKPKTNPVNPAAGSNGSNQDAMAKNESKPATKTEIKANVKTTETAVKSPESVEPVKQEVSENKAKETIATEKNISESTSNSEAAFTLQLGSFVNNPDMSKFKQLGKVDLRKENDRYKVYYGKFNSKAEAAEMRQKTVSKGFDCFVVAIKK